MNSRIFPILLYSLALSASPQEGDSLQTTRSMVSLPSLALNLGASALVPGLGQALNRYYIKGGLFFASQAITGAVAVDRYLADNFWAIRVGAREDTIAQWSRVTGVLADSLQFYRSSMESAGRTPEDQSSDSARIEALMMAYTPAVRMLGQAQVARDLSAYDRRLNRYAAYNATCWWAGLYVLNLMDVINSSGVITQQGNRDPILAGWLGAIPALGLGQLYNGFPVKAGFLFAAQTGLGTMAFNYHRLMVQAQDHGRKVGTLLEGDRTLIARFEKDWQYRRDNAFRRRNMYLWYSLILYLYGVFDAIVDAHLSDLPERMRLEPDLAGTPGFVGVTLSMDLRRTTSTGKKTESGRFEKWQ